MVTAARGDVVDLDEKRHSDQAKGPVDLRAVEPLTSPVRGERKASMGLHRHTKTAIQQVGRGTTETGWKLLEVGVCGLSSDSYGTSVGCRDGRVSLVQVPPTSAELP